MDKPTPMPDYGPAPGYGPMPPPGYGPAPPPGFSPGSSPGFTPAPPPPPYNEPLRTEPQQNVVILGPTQFGSESQRVTCPHCHASVSTAVETEANMKTHLFAILLCVLGLWCCAPCPYCMDSCMAKKHYCPSCKAYLGESNN